MSDRSLSNLSPEDIVGLVLISIGLAISSAAGIGGGSIVVPILLLVLQFNTLDAVPLGNAAVLGSTLSNILFTVSKSHPLDLNRSIIDWDIISMMEPNAMIGALIGAYLHKILPETVLKVSLAFLLCITSYRTFSRGLKDYSTHMTISKQEYQIIIPITSTSDMSIDIKSTNYHSIDQKDDILDRDKTMKTFDIEKINAYAIEPKNENVKQTNIGVLIFLFVGTILINIAKGSNFIINLFVVDGKFVLNLILVFFIIFVSFWLRHLVITNHQRRIIKNYDLLKGDILWNNRNSLVYPSAAAFAGMVAGLFGIGGGIVKAPLLIEMGVHPVVVSSTTTVMIFFTSTTAMSSYIAYGHLKWDYAILLFLLGIISNIFGQTFISKIVEFYESTSIITIIIAILVGISAILMTFASFSNIR